jgi:hypothetical protein
MYEGHHHASMWFKKIVITNVQPRGLVSEGSNAATYFDISRRASDEHIVSIAMRYMWSEMLSFA